MADPLQLRYQINGPTSACTDAPKEPENDPCKVYVSGKSVSSTDFAFELIRNKGQFKIDPKDQSLVQKFHPKFQVPQNGLKDFLQVQSHFLARYGDSESPSSFTDTIQVIDKGGIFAILNSTANFLAFGNLTPSTENEKFLMETAIKNSIAAFADPTMGNMLVKIFEDLKKETNLSPNARKRVEFLLRVSQVREVFWQVMDPLMSQSKTLSDNFKASTWQLVHFLMAEYVLADKGYSEALSDKRIRKTAQVHHEVMSQIDSTYTVEKNYYRFMSEVIKDVGKKIQLPQDIDGDFKRRLGLAEAEYRKEATKETQRLLPKEKPIMAFNISLGLKYGTNPWRKEALKIILNSVDVKERDGKPYYIVKMASMDKGLREWFRGLKEKQKSEAMGATLYLVDQLLERGEKIDGYWGGKFTKVDSFFGSDSFGKSLFGGNNNKILQDLVDYLRSQRSVRHIPINPDADPHVHFRKWTILGEGLGTGLAVGSYFVPWSEDPTTTYNARFGSTIAIGAGLGAMAGNGLSYAFNVDKDYAWLLDVGGGLVGGLVTGLIYNAAASKPMMPMGPPLDDPGRRNPVDPYGP